MTKLKMETPASRRIKEKLDICEETKISANNRWEGEQTDSDSSMETGMEDPYELISFLAKIAGTLRCEKRGLLGLGRGRPSTRIPRAATLHKEVHYRDV
jgi:hypothetical protein